MNSSARVRFAPSPTGYLHIGGARTAIYNWLLAKATGGRFILRIEDTDQNRYVPDALVDIMESLRWLGIEWDEGPDAGGETGPYFQSHRLNLYHKYAAQLVDEGRAYHCFCSAERLAAVRAAQEAAKEAPGYDRHCRALPKDEVAAALARGDKSVVRLMTPLAGSTTFTDEIRGEITVDNRTLDDLVLLKSDGFPTYHLANIIDDHHMGITHVMRGDEWIASTPRHVLLYQAFGWQPPKFAHLPVFLAPSGGGKLSKRHGATSVREYRDKGYLPEALFNFLLLLGWHPQGEREMFTAADAVEVFTLARVSKAAVAFSTDKLDWFNGLYIRQLTPADLAGRVLPYLQHVGLLPDPCPEERFAYLVRVIPLVQERLRLLAEAPEVLDIFLKDAIPPPAADLLVGRKQTPAQVLAILTQAAAVLAGLTAFDEPALEAALREVAAALGIKDGEVFMPLRVAVSGRAATPGIFETLAAIGRERCVARIEKAAAVLAAR